MNGDGSVADNDVVAEAAQLFCNRAKRQAVKVRNPDNCLADSLGTYRLRLQNRTPNMLSTPFNINTQHSSADKRVRVLIENR